RELTPKNFLIGVSTHTFEEAKMAKDEGADFVVFGPVFETISKPITGPPKGIANLRRVCAALAPFPVIALGGVDRTNFESAIEAGAGGFASIGFLNEPENLRKFGKRNQLYEK
ncbi:MAG: thiamine phosphate synthase, partial [Acidobacteria bacterium]|nr:thiamine phosphate synthase [Acidobacteriota bacterium]